MPTGSLFEDSDDEGDGGLIPPPPPEDSAVGMSEAAQAAEASLRAEGRRVLREVRSIFTWCLRVEGTADGEEAGTLADETALSDEQVRRILRFAVGSEMTKTQGEVELALGRADGGDVKELLEQLIQITDDGVVTFAQLLEPVRLTTSRLTPAAPSLRTCPVTCQRSGPGSGLKLPLGGVKLLECPCQTAALRDLPRHPLRRASGPSRILGDSTGVSYTLSFPARRVATFRNVVRGTCVWSAAVDGRCE